MEEVKEKRHYNKKPKEVVPPPSDIESGYQHTVRIQMDQIRALVKQTEDIQSDVLTLKAERDELMSGLIKVRTAIDSLHRLLHEGENRND